MKIHGLRFDGEYRTTSPVPFDGFFASTFELRLHFESNRLFHFWFRALDEEEGLQTEVDTYSGQDQYFIERGERVRFGIDTGIWVCEWDGLVQEDSLVMTYRIEEYFGLSSGPKCVREGEVSLTFKCAID